MSTEQNQPTEFPHLNMAKNRRQGRKLFIDRMKREGRHDEWRHRLKVHTSAGDSFAKAATKVQKEMGYAGINHEIELERRRLLGDKAREKAYESHARKELEAPERAARNLEEAVASLPMRAPYQDEIDWIRAHPAMMRLSVAEDKTKLIKITVKDVFDTPAGKAPSQSAVYMLQHWANQPGKFYEKTLDEHKKIKDADQKKTASSVDVGIGEIEALLGEVAKESQ